MSEKFNSVEEAFMILAQPGNPDWMAAFSFLIEQPDTAALVLETFRETLEQMGVAPSGTDPVTGEPQYNLADVARAMGIPETDLDIAVTSANGQTQGGEKQ